MPLVLAGLDPSLRDRPIHALSGAQARKVALAGILVLDRPLLILDEPTAALDAPSRREIRALLARLKGEGRTIVIVSHRLADLAPLTDRLLVVEEGVSLFQGTIAGAITDERLAASWKPDWPPVIDLMLRLGKTMPSLDPCTDDPREAARRIAAALAGA
jgi:energy-coupling factor transport system ATP-binding protein